MDDKIVKNYYLEKNYFLENYHELTDKTIRDLEYAYQFLRIVPFYKFTEEDDIDEEIKNFYKKIVEMNVILQENILNALCIFKSLKELDKEFTRQILENAVSTDDPNLIKLVQVMKETLMGMNSDENNMRGGGRGSLFCKLIILLTLLTSITVPIKSQQTDKTYDYNEEFLREVLEENIDYTDTDFMEDIKVERTGKTNEKPNFKQFTTNGENDFQVGTVNKKLEFGLPEGFRIEQERKVKKLKKEAPNIIAALMIQPKTQEQILEEMRDQIYDLNEEFKKTYQDTKKNCKKLVNRFASSGFLDPSKHQQVNSTETEDEDTSSIFSGWFWSSSDTNTKNETMNNESMQSNTTAEMTPISNVINNNKTTLNSIVQNAMTNKEIAAYKEKEGLQKDAIYFCETLFDPNVTLFRNAQDKTGIQTKLSGFSNFLPFMDSLQTNMQMDEFDKFVPVLMEIQTKINVELEKKSYSKNDKNYLILKDITEKTQVLLDIIDISKTAVYYFGNEEEFNNKISEVKTLKTNVEDLNTLFNIVEPISYRGNIQEKKREAEITAQKTEQEKILHEAEKEYNIQDLNRQKENLEIDRNATEISKGQAKNFVEGTFGVAAEGVKVAVNATGEVVNTGFIQIGNWTVTLSGPIWEILKILAILVAIGGSGITIYGLYWVINARMVASRVTRVVLPGQPQPGVPQPGVPVQPGQQQPGQQPVQPGVPQPGQPQPGEQFLIFNFGNEQRGLITRINMQQNNQFQAFFGVYFVDENSAVRLLNIRQYFENVNDNNKIIFYNDPPNFMLCGKYRGITPQNTILIQTPGPNSAIIPKDYNAVIDPVMNNYALAFPDLLRQCIINFNGEVPPPPNNEVPQPNENPIPVAVPIENENPIPVAVPIENENNQEDAANALLNLGNDQPNENPQPNENIDEDVNALLNLRGQRGGNKHKTYKKKYRKKRNTKGKKNYSLKNKTIKKERKSKTRTYKQP
jgi:hypothetical protein